MKFIFSLLAWTSTLVIYGQSVPLEETLNYAVLDLDEIFSIYNSSYKETGDSVSYSYQFEDYYFFDAGTVAYTWRWKDITDIHISKDKNHWTIKSKGNSIIYDNGTRLPTESISLYPLYTSEIQKSKAGEWLLEQVKKAGGKAILVYE